MELVAESKISGAFTGWHQDAVFELVNGQIWQQKRYKYRYKYRYRPNAKIWKDGTKYYIEVDGMQDMIEVKRSSRRVVCEGQLAGEFSGWDGETVFEFTTGQKWKQARYEYYYHYSYRPHARVWQDGGRYYLEVDGTGRQLEVAMVW